MPNDRFPHADADGFFRWFDFRIHVFNGDRYRIRNSAGDEIDVDCVFDEYPEFYVVGEEDRQAEDVPGFGRDDWGIKPARPIDRLAIPVRSTGATLADDLAALERAFPANVVRGEGQAITDLIARLVAGTARAEDVYRALGYEVQDRAGWWCNMGIRWPKPGFNLHGMGDVTGQIDDALHLIDPELRETAMCAAMAHSAQMTGNGWLSDPIARRVCIVALTHPDLRAKPY